MGLEMRNECERCGDDLDDNDECYICVYECSWCPDCTDAMDHVCPTVTVNWYDDLDPRPPPKRAILR